MESTILADKIVNKRIDIVSRQVTRFSYTRFSGNLQILIGRHFLEKHSGVLHEGACRNDRKNGESERANFARIRLSRDFERRFHFCAVRTRLNETSDFPTFQQPPPTTSDIFNWLFFAVSAFSYGVLRGSR